MNSGTVKKMPDLVRRQLVIGVRDDTGLVRKNNEDSHCALLPPNTPMGIGGILAVADGVGGQEGGEIASQMAVDGVASMLGRKPGSPAPPAADMASLLHSTIIEINRQVFDAAFQRQGGSAMGTTLSIAVVLGKTLWVGHVGDSRVYVYHDDVLEQVTPDHSWVAEEVARGAMTRDEAATDRRRNLLTRAIGTAAQVQPSIIKTELLPGDTILLCSDGLYGMVAEERISAVLDSKPPSEAADILIDMANTAGGADNITAIVARVLTIEDLPESTWDGDPGSTTVVSGNLSGKSPFRYVTAPVLAPWRAMRWFGRKLHSSDS